MHHIISIARAFFVSKGTLVLLFLLLATSSVLADDTYCDPKLGRNYDQQTAEEKMARMNIYLDCRHLQDSRFLQSKRKDMLRGIQKWQNRTKRVTDNSLTTKRTIAKAELKAVHETERGDLEATYRNQYTELEAIRTADNARETNSKRVEITRAHRTDRRAMVSRQYQERNLQHKTFYQCSVTVTNEINQLRNGDTKNVNQQYLEKSARLKREYDDVKAAPMTMSLNDYAASQSSAPVGEIDAVEGEVTVNDVDVVPGTPIYQGDIVETGADSRCNIVFADGTSLATGENTSYEINENDRGSEGDGGEGNFSVLRGIFVFISGLIGRKEAVDVEILYRGGGSIGLRG